MKVCEGRKGEDGGGGCDGLILRAPNTAASFLPAAHFFHSTSVAPFLSHLIPILHRKVDREL